MSVHDDGMDPATPPRVYEWTKEQIDAAQCGVCDLAHIQTTCAQGASRTALENLRFRLHVKWGTVEIPLKTPLLPLSVTPEDIADSFGCSPPDATNQRKSYKLWLVGINPRTGGFESVITRNAAAIVIPPDQAPVRQWECDPQHAQQVNAEFGTYMAWRQKNAGRHHLTGQPWRAPDEAEGYEGDDNDDRDGEDFGAFAPPPPQRFPQAPQAFAQLPQGFAPPIAPQAFPQAPQGFAPPIAPQAFPQAPQTFAQAAALAPRQPSAAEAEVAELRRMIEAMKAQREADEREAAAKRLKAAEEEAIRLRRDLEDARRARPEAPTRDLGTTVAAVVSAAAPLLEIFKASVESTREREKQQREDDERRRRDERDREDKRREEEERRREEARREDERREERRREDARRDEDKREERRREERAEAHKERMATLKAGGGADSAMSEALAAVRAEIAELKGGGKRDKGGVLGAIKEAREIMGLLGGKTEALDAAAKAAEVGDQNQNQTLEIIDTIGDKLEAPFKMLASEFMADREAKRKAAAARRGGYVQRGSGLLAAKRAKLADGTEIEVPDDMVLLNDGTMIPLASWGNYLAAMQTPQFAPAPAFPQAPMFAFAPQPQPQVAAFAQPQAPMFAQPQVAAFAPPADATQTAQEEAPPPQEAPPQVEVIEEAQEPPAVSAHDGPALDEVPEFTG